MKNKLRTLLDSYSIYRLQIKGSGFYAVVVTALSLISSMLPSLNALLMTALAAALSGSGRSLWMLVLLVAGVAGIDAIYDALGVAENYFTVRIAQRAELTMHIALQDNVCKFDCREHEQSDFARKLKLARNALDLYDVEHVLEGVPKLLGSAVAFVVAAVLLGRLGWYLPVAGVAVSMAIMWVHAKSNDMYNRGIQASDVDRMRAQTLYEQMLSMEHSGELRIYGRFNWMIDEWKSEFKRTSKRVLALKDGEAVLSKLIGVAVEAFALVMAYLYISGGAEGSAENIMLAFTSFTALERAISGINGSIRELDMFAVFNSNYMALVRAPREKKREPGVNVKPVAVALDGVTFSYDGENDVLHGVSLDIRPGEKLALVGENGSGKTTLAKLILQLYHPKTGALVIADEDGAIGSCRATAVLQDYVKYQLTVRENIAMGDIDKPDSDAAVFEAYSAVCEGEPPLALDEIVGKQFGERELSGGEWQRLAIARAYFREAPLIVLDEPNASIDAFAEAAMIKRMFSMARDKTCVFITHRLTTTALADRIAVMKDGQICEQGTHEELLRRNGEYARMYNVQSQMYV